MKLRLRSVESKQTLKLEIPGAYTFHQLKQHLSQTLNLNPDPNLSLHFSLNNKDELLPSSPHDPLQTLGLASGDLLFYTPNPNLFSSPNPQTLGPNSMNSQSVQVGIEGSSNLGTMGAEENSNSKLGSSKDGKSEESSDFEMMGSEENPSAKSVLSEKGEIEESSDLVAINSVSGGSHSQVISDSMDYEKSFDIEPSSSLNLQTLGNSEGYVELGEGRFQETNIDMEVDPGSLGLILNKYSEPYFLRRVLRKELGKVGGSGGDHRLLVIAIHAVMLESGFVGCDSVTGARIDGFHLPDVWPSAAFTMSLQYSLPELLDSNNTNVGGVLLKFLSLGNFLNIYGCLDKGNGKSAVLRRVCLDENRYAPTLGVMIANYDKEGDATGDAIDTCLGLYHEEDIFEFWKIVKDGLALPLLIDLSERAGLGLPSCLMRLPTDLKLKIMESLLGVDVAKLARVSTEFRYISSNNDLWKQKYVEEFGEETQVAGTSQWNWKQRFAMSWELKKRRKRDRTAMQRPLRLERRQFFPIRRDPNPLGLPGMIGGDYDRLPGLGVHSPFGLPGAFPRVQLRRNGNVTPHCNLGGLSFNRF